MLENWRRSASLLTTVKGRGFIVVCLIAVLVGIARAGGDVLDLAAHRAEKGTPGHAVDIDAVDVEGPDSVSHDRN